MRKKYEIWNMYMHVEEGQTGCEYNDDDGFSHHDKQHVLL